MENDATKTRSLNMAFVVDEHFLRRVEALLGQIKGTLEYDVQFSDGTTVKYPKAEEVTNESDSRIISMIAAVEGRDGHSAYLTMRDSPSPSVEYTVTGPKRDVILFAVQLDKLVAASQQWYSWLFSSNVGVVLALIAFLGPLASWDTLYRHLFSGLASKGKAPGWLSLTAIIVMYLAEYGISKLFPRGTFAIGPGLKRHKEISGVRTVVLYSFAVAIFAEWVMRHF